MTAADPGRMLSARQVADRLGVNPKTVHRWASEGRLTRVRLGPRVIRFHQSEVDGLIRKNSYRAA